MVQFDVAAKVRSRRPNLDGAAAIGIVGVGPKLAPPIALKSRFVGQASRVVVAGIKTLCVRFSSLRKIVFEEAIVANGLAIVLAVATTTRIAGSAASTAIAAGIGRVTAVGAARPTILAGVVEQKRRRTRRRAGWR